MNVGVWLYSALALASLISVLARRPWTIPLARRRTAPAVWSTDLFLETNLALSGGWTLLFAGGAAVSALTPLWGQMAYGALLAVFGRASHNVAGWYSARRLRAMAAAG